MIEKGLGKTRGIDKMRKKGTLKGLDRVREKGTLREPDKNRVAAEGLHQKIKTTSHQWREHPPGIEHPRRAAENNTNLTGNTSQQPPLQRSVSTQTTG